MKKKIFQCPDCGSILLRDCELKDNFWQKLNCYELSAFETILQSKILQVVTGEFNVIPTHCENCLDKRNPKFNLN